MPLHAALPTAASRDPPLRRALEAGPSPGRVQGPGARRSLRQQSPPGLPVGLCTHPRPPRPPAAVVRAGKAQVGALPTWVQGRPRTGGRPPGRGRGVRAREGSEGHRVLSCTRTLWGLLRRRRAQVPTVLPPQGKEGPRSLGGGGDGDRGRRRGRMDPRGKRRPPG